MIECATVVAGTPATPEQIFGGVDAMKLHSSATLFARAAPEEPAFRAVLDNQFAGALDPATERLLSARL
jgi:uncharacterized protein (DUF1810 family)